MSGIPGLGYSAQSSTTRMSPQAYLSARPLPPAPIVSITSPQSGAYVPAGAISFVVTAAQTNGFLTQLRLFSGTNLLATLPLSGSPASFTGAISATLPSGPQSITLAALDSNGQTTTSAPLNFMAQSPSFRVTITSPTNGAAYQPFSTIPVSATASSPGGPITNLVIFMDGAVLGNGTNPPFALAVPQVAPGLHQFYAQALDSAGNGGISATVAATVSAPALNHLIPFLSTNTLFSAGFTGVASSNYVFELATNLSPPVTWTPVQTKHLSTAGTVFTDPASGQNPGGYYRSALLNRTVTNPPAFSVSAGLNSQVAASDQYDNDGALLLMTNLDGTV
jgi:hypothetical protein